MSFDLWVWHSDEALSVEEAGELYVKLFEQTGSATEEHPAVKSFYQGLCRTYSDIGSLPEDEVDDCLCRGPLIGLGSTNIRPNPKPMLLLHSNDDRAVPVQRVPDMDKALTGDPFS